VMPLRAQASLEGADLLHMSRRTYGEGVLERCGVLGWVPWNGWEGSVSRSA
jgi:hypothetical protein